VKELESWIDKTVRERRDIQFADDLEAYELWLSEKAEELRKILKALRK